MVCGDLGGGVGGEWEKGGEAQRQAKGREHRERERGKDMENERNKRQERSRERKREKKTPLAENECESEKKLTLVLNARMRAVPPIPSSLPTPRASEAASKSMAARLGMNRSNCGRRYQRENEKEGERERWRESYREGKLPKKKKKKKRLSFFPSLRCRFPAFTGFTPSLPTPIHSKQALQEKTLETHRLLLPVGCVAERGGGEEGGGGNCNALHSGQEKTNDSAGGGGGKLEGTAASKQASKRAEDAI